MIGKSIGPGLWPRFHPRRAGANGGKLKMNVIAQNIAVALVVGLCAAYVGWQLIQAFRGRKSKLGSCCAKGFSAAEKKMDTSPKPAQFMPLANVGRPRPK